MLKWHKYGLNGINLKKESHLKNILGVFIQCNDGGGTLVSFSDRYIGYLFFSVGPQPVVQEDTEAGKGWVGIRSRVCWTAACNFRQILETLRGSKMSRKNATMENTFCLLSK